MREVAARDQHDSSALQHPLEHAREPVDGLAILPSHQNGDERELRADTGEERQLQFKRMLARVHRIVYVDPL